MILRKIPVQEGDKYYDYGAYTGKYEYIIKCDNCGEEFQHENRLKCYCSQKCVNDVNVKNRKEFRDETRKKVCGYCHKSFQRARIDSLYCSNACRQAAYRHKETPVDQTALYTIQKDPYYHFSDKQITKLNDNGIRCMIGTYQLSASEIRKLTQVNMEYIHISNLIVPDDFNKAFWKKEITQKELEARYKKYLQGMKLNTIIDINKTDRMALIIPDTPYYKERENCYNIILPEAVKKAKGFKEIISM